MARDEPRGLALLAAAAAQGNKDAIREHDVAVRRIAARDRSDDENLAAALEQHGLQGHAAAIRALLRPSIRLVAEACDDASIAVGASKLGGSPDVAPGFAWPHRGDRPLAFIAQLDLADIAPHHDGSLLPREGLLAFFYDADKQPWGRPCRPRGRGAIPRLRARRLRRADPPAMAQRADPQPRGRDPRPLLPVHRGHGEHLPPRLRGADPDRLLLQIDSDERAGMMWGDSGRLFFWMREADLRAARWREARLQLQCH